MPPLFLGTLHEMVTLLHDKYKRDDTTKNNFRIEGAVLNQKTIFKIETNNGTVNLILKKFFGGDQKTCVDLAEFIAGFTHERIKKTQQITSLIQ